MKNMNLCPKMSLVQSLSTLAIGALLSLTSVGQAQTTPNRFQADSARTLNQQNIRAGNGAGYNGPDRSGVSIPIELERGITIRNAQKAQLICLLTGDANAGRISLLQQLAKQIYGSRIVRYEYRYQQRVKAFSNMVSVVPNQADLEGHYLLEVFLTGESKPKWIEYRDLGHGNPVVELGYNSEMGVHIQHPTAVSPEGRAISVRLSSARSGSGYEIPSIRYHRVVQDVRYDQWGVAQQDPLDALIGEFLVLSSAFPVKFPEAGPIYNGQSGRLLPIKMNEAEYAECLSEEIQKRAE